MQFEVFLDISMLPCSFCCLPSVEAANNHSRDERSVEAGGKRDRDDAHSNTNRNVVEEEAEIKIVLVVRDEFAVRQLIRVDAGFLEPIKDVVPSICASPFASSPQQFVCKKEGKTLREQVQNRPLSCTDNVWLVRGGS